MAEQIRSYFPDWRVYVFGVDVTEDLTSCNINYNSGGRAPNTAEIELVSRREIQPTDENGLSEPVWTQDRYIVDKIDIRSMYADVNLETANLTAKRDRIQELVTSVEDAESLSEAERIESEYLEAVGDFEAAYLEELAERVGATTIDPLKERVLKTKVQYFQSITDSYTGDPFALTPDPQNPYGKSSISTLQLQQLTGRVFRFPFQVGDCIFHTNDPVRIFWRDPTNPEQWYHMFAGFITDWTDSVDANNQSIVRLRMEDASRILRYARITTNPGILDIRTAATENDAVLRTFFNQGFSDLTLPEFLFLIIFGSSRTEINIPGTTDDLTATRTFDEQSISVNGFTNRTLDREGIGAFNFDRSFVALWGPPSDDATPVPFNNVTVENLGQYHALVDHRVYFSDLINMYNGLNDADYNRALGDVEFVVDRNGDRRPVESTIVKAIGENPHIFPVDFGRLVMLIPNSLGPGENRDLLLRDLTGVATQTSWTTRLGLIYDTVERIDFSFYCSPRGDLICEMPLYDFEPRDFGDELVKMDELPGFTRGLANTTQRDAEISAAQQTRIPGLVASRIALSVQSVDVDGVYAISQFDNERGPYGPQLRVNKSDTVSWERTFTDERIRTQMRGVYNLIPGFGQQATSDAVGEQVHILLPGLVPQFGVRGETIDARGIINNERAAEIYSLVLLNRMNAEARTAKVEVLPRVWFGFPNRPVEFAERNFVGTLAQITHGLVWGVSGDMTMSFDVKYIRGWAGQTEDGSELPVYETIGGFASNPLNYALRFGLRPGAPNSTVTEIRGGRATNTRR